MSRATEFDFVSTDGQVVLDELIQRYEQITGRTLNSADPDRVFLAWIADLIVRERVNQNYIGNQNIPSRAEGINLDAIGEWIFNLTRNPAQAAKCTMRFVISSAQETAIAIPAGTRVTDYLQRLVFSTSEDTVIPIGSTSVDVMAQCETEGIAGNGLTAGQINILVDVDSIPYFSSCANLDETDGGAEVEDDDSYYERMKLSLDSFSTAGAEGSYRFHAKSVSNEIADVKAIRPKSAVTETIPLYTGNDTKKYGFIGGDVSNLRLYPVGSTTPYEADTDYTTDYSDGLLKITATPGRAVATQSSIKAEYTRENAGHVNIYAIMNDGSIAGQTIKEAILSACNDEYVRPLTDYVQVLDPGIKTYNVNLTYYIANGTQIPVTDIQTAVQEAVNQYVEWQSEKLGRDINPAKLWQLLMQTGIKRAVISSPVFTVVESGSSGTTPEIASIGTINIVNGGYEDE